MQYLDKGACAWHAFQIVEQESRTICVCAQFAVHRFQVPTQCGSPIPLARPTRNSSAGAAFKLPLAFRCSLGFQGSEGICQPSRSSSSLVSDKGYQPVQGIPGTAPNIAREQPAPTLLHLLIGPWRCCAIDKLNVKTNKLSHPEVCTVCPDASCASWTYVVSIEEGF